MSARVPGRTGRWAAALTTTAVRASTPTAVGTATSGKRGGATGVPGRLARPMQIERSWGHGTRAGSDSLDRFESAVAFAIREAARLQHEPESGRVMVSRIEVSQR